MIVGSLDPWADSFPDDWVASLIEVLIQAWYVAPTLVGGRLEDQITRRFVGRVRRSKNARKLPFSVQCQYEVIDEDGGIVGRIDICAQHGHREDVYLAFECKRLNVPDAKGRIHRRSSEYVKQGVVRFVQGQYAGPVGGMIAYVLDGDVAAAMTGVEGALTTNASLLAFDQQPASMGRSARCPTLEQVRQTTHRIAGEQRVLEHIFLACA